MPDTAVTMSDNYPGETRALTFTFNCPVNNPDTVIFEFSGYYKFTSRSGKVCDVGKTCYVYEDPVN